MPSSLPSSDAVIERARPLLGTVAAIRARWKGSAHAGAVDRAFAAIADVQARMSAFSETSDLGRLHAAPIGQVVPLDPRTRHVMAFALDLAEASHGVFDIALGGEAAVQGTYPIRAGAAYPLAAVQGASWRDIALQADGVMLRRPLWVDLNGIAKGFAVDEALACLEAAGAVQATVNIGGDLAVFGPDAETVHLRTTADTPAPEIVLSEGGLASSGGAIDLVTTRHIGVARTALDPRRFACVLAPGAMAADALTKVVLGVTVVDEALLGRYQAKALAWAPTVGWRSYGDPNG